MPDDNDNNNVHPNEPVPTNPSEHTEAGGILPPPQHTRRRNRKDVPDPLKADEQVNADQIAAIVGVNKRTIFRWLAGGHLPPYDFKVGQTCRWKMTTIRDWLAAGPGTACGRRRPA
jgi:predicted DNA-binding transcriptional regulator AlpA